MEISSVHEHKTILTVVRVTKFWVSRTLLDTETSLPSQQNNKTQFHCQSPVIKSSSFLKRNTLTLKGN